MKFNFITIIKLTVVIFLAGVVCDLLHYEHIGHALFLIAIGTFFMGLTWIPIKQLYMSPLDQQALSQNVFYKRYSRVDLTVNISITVGLLCWLLTGVIYDLKPGSRSTWFIISYCIFLIGIIFKALRIFRAKRLIGDNTKDTSL